MDSISWMMAGSLLSQAMRLTNDFENRKELGRAQNWASRSEHLEELKKQTGAKGKRLAG